MVMAIDQWQMDWMAMKNSTRPRRHIFSFSPLATSFLFYLEHFAR